MIMKSRDFETQYWLLLDMKLLKIKANKKRNDDFRFILDFQTDKFLNFF